MSHELIADYPPSSQLSSVPAPQSPSHSRPQFHTPTANCLASTTSQTTVRHRVSYGTPTQTQIPHHVQSRYPHPVMAGHLLEDSPFTDPQVHSNVVGNSTASSISPHAMSNIKALYPGSFFQGTPIPLNQTSIAMSNLQGAPGVPSHSPALVPLINPSHRPCPWSSGSLGFRTHFPLSNNSSGYTLSAGDHTRAAFQDDSNLQKNFAPPATGVLQPGYSPIGLGLNIVLEDPNSPCSYREKKTRTRKDSEEQKRNTRLLKELGGACLWCYRSKKRCGTRVPCNHCQSMHRECIREFTQLCLFSPADKSSSSKGFRAKGRSSQQINDFFCRLKDKASQLTGHTRVVVGFRRFGTEQIDFWVADLTKLNMTQLNTSDSLNQQLVSKSMKHIHSLALDDIETKFPDHSLVQSALSMSRLVATIRCLAKTRVHVRAADIDPARIAMFYTLAVYVQRLCEISEDFCSELFDTFRRKETTESCANGKRDPIDPKFPNPTWIAAGLYYRVIDDLSSLELSPPTAIIFEDIKPHLGGVRSNLLTLLRYIPYYLNSNAKNNKPKDLLKQHIPIVSVLQYFSVAVWLHSSDQFLPPTALYRQADPFSSASYDTQSLLDDNFGLITYLPTSDSGSQNQYSSQFLEPLEQETLEPELSSGTSTEFESLRQDMIMEGFLDPLSFQDWDGATEIDFFYKHENLDLPDGSQLSTQTEILDMNSYHPLTSLGL